MLVAGLFGRLATALACLCVRRPTTPALLWAAIAQGASTPARQPAIAAFGAAGWH